MFKGSPVFQGGVAHNLELWLPLKKDNPKLKIAVSGKKLQKWKESSDKIWRI